MISFTRVSKQYGGQILFVEADLQLNLGEKAGLVGPNGAGKTTLFRLIAGEEEADEGEIGRPRRLSIGYFRQDVGDLKGRTVLAETMAGAGEVAELADELGRVEAALAAQAADAAPALLDRYGALQERFESLGGYELEARAQAILAGLGLTPAQVSGDVGHLSGGWKMRVALARILLCKPDVMLLDEPTNYLDLESILWLETFLRDCPSAVLMTCHDRDVMNRVVSRIIEIDGGEVRTFTGDYDFYERARAVEAARREAEYDRQQAMLAKEMRFVERFKAQAAKAAQVQSRVKKLEKIEKVELPRRLVERNFDFRQPPRSGEDVVKIAGLRKGYGGRPVHDGLDLVVRRAERWAVMGENGTGKTTLLKLIAGVLAPDAGSVALGAGVTLGYFAQHQMEQLDGAATVLEELQHHTRTAGIGVLRNAAGAFGFHGDDVEKRVAVLSGGEKARLALLKIFFDAPNLLVLDEPTNHLDLVTKRMLVRTLSSYEGTLVFVSHDRTFLRGLANRVMEIGASAPGGHCVYGGSYDEYVASVGRAAPGMRGA